MPEQKESLAKKQMPETVYVRKRSVIALQTACVPDYLTCVVYAQ